MVLKPKSCIQQITHTNLSLSGRPSSEPSFHLGGGWSFFFEMCLTLRLKTVADCLTSLLSSITTALTPATVTMKFVNTHCFDLRIRFSDSNVFVWMARGFKEGLCFYLEKQPRQVIRSFIVWFTHCSGIPFYMGHCFCNCLGPFESPIGYGVK